MQSKTLTWGDGEHKFALAIGHLRELQDKCDAGPQQIWQRLSIGQWRVDDVRETIRLGLIGGGLTPTEAHKLTVRYVDERPLLESVTVAQLVLMLALVPSEEDDDTGKEQAGSAPQNASRSRPSTDGAASSGSPPDK